MKSLPTAYEHAIQAQFVESFRMCSSERDVLLASIPNESPPAWLGLLIRLGMVPGMPDMALLWNPAQVAFLEFKAASTPITPNQVEIHRRLDELGFRFKLVRSFEEAWRACIAWEVPVRARPVLFDPPGDAP